MPLYDKHIVEIGVVKTKLVQALTLLKYAWFFYFDLGAQKTQLLKYGA
jgi:hypothetical protein